MNNVQRVAVVGGGPAGLRAAEVLAESGSCAVTLFEQKRSVGRKFLVAGRGGLNLTHSEPLRGFVGRYSDGPWARLLAGFGPEDAKQWAGGLGSPTFVGTSGRVFPKEKQAAKLLRAWVKKLRENGVRFVVHERLSGLASTENGVELSFGKEPQTFDAVVLALGGASWPETGSDATWTAMLAEHGVEVRAWQAANCGWEVAWPEEFVREFEGTPWKNLAVSANGVTVRGELLVTKYGLEGGCVYQLGPQLRQMREPELTIDFRPDSAKPVRMDSLPGNVRWWMEHGGELHRTVVRLEKPRPISEAISSAGGVAWAELDDTLMLHKLPGVWVCGEMIEWEAPTGGYLLQGCLTTGTAAANGVLALEVTSTPV